MADPLMDVGYWVVYGIAAIVFGFILLRLYAYHWEPVQGAGNPDYLTILAYTGEDDHMTYTGYWYDVTSIYIFKQAVLGIIQICRNDLRTRMLELVNERMEPKDDESAATLQVLRPYYIAAARGQSLPDELRLIVGRTIGGGVHFFIQHGRLQPLRDYATFNRGIGMEWVWQLVGRFGRGLVSGDVEDIESPVARQYQRLTDLPVKGQWHWLCPRPKRSQTGEPLQPAPSTLLAELVVANKPVWKALRMEKVMARFARDSERTAHAAQGLAMEKNLELNEVQGALMDLGLEDNIPTKRTSDSAVYVMAGLAIVGILVGWYIFHDMGFAIAGGVLGVFGGVFAAKSGVLNR